jgi:hypothetical protein
VLLLLLGLLVAAGILGSRGVLLVVVLVEATVGDLGLEVAHGRVRPGTIGMHRHLSRWVDGVQFFRVGSDWEGISREDVTGAHRIVDVAGAVTDTSSSRSVDAAHHGGSSNGSHRQTSFRAGILGDREG